MSTLIDAGKVAGKWSGRNLLWLGPEEPVRESATEATVTAAAANGFLVLAYSWSDQGKPHDGVLMARTAAEQDHMAMVWVDSFHTMGKFMRFEGRPTTDGSVEATTRWSIGDGPDWGWRIVLSCPSADELLVRMYVATPEGEEAPAVEARYERGAARGT